MTRIVCVTTAFAALVATEAATSYVTGAAALRIPLSVEQAGMGGIGVIGEDAEAGWRNPSLLSEQRQSYVLSGLGGTLLGGETRLMSIGGGYRINDRLSLAAMFMSTGGSFEEVDMSGVSTGAMIRQATSALGAMVAVKLGSSLALGATIKVVRDEVMSDRATAPLGDCGALIKLGSMDVGLAVLNLGGQLRDIPNFLSDNFPAGDASVGIVWSPGAGIRLAGEGAILLEGHDYERLGVEWRPVKTFALRIGVNAPNGSYSRMTGSAGFSVAWRSMHLDYAFQSAPIVMNHEIGLTVAFE